ncbi:MAG: diguanylate cyclase [Desulfobacteraceae bacterium]|nr:diguanylate cyclase [Desulfobacteraceae bacterium]MBC2755868.1 diguanylate cyclase [Desulfobacteraceae bacterium]MBC2763965.1 diguanylate cyclase [ANME-2 cluster archaeon]
MKQEIGERYLQILLGDADKFSFQNRVLNAAIFSSTVISILGFIACIVIRLPKATFLLAIVSAGAFFALYGIGRWLRNFVWLVWAYLIFNYIIIFYYWLFIGGYTGISLSIALVLTCILPLLLSGRPLFIAFISNCSVVSAIYFIEMMFPEYMINHEPSIQYLSEKFFSIIILGSGIALLVLLVMRSYRFQQEKIRWLTLKDELTQLYNRRFFNQIFPREISRARRDDKSISLLMMDLDDFKKYNDTYGHQKGDHVLVSIGSLLRSLAARASDYAFRLGGEEFAVVFSGHGPQQAGEFSEKIRIKIAELKIKHQNDSAGPFLTASMGLTTRIPDAEMDMNWFYKISDKAMYLAKSNGKNRIEIT